MRRRSSLLGLVLAGWVAVPASAAPPPSLKMLELTLRGRHRQTGEAVDKVVRVAVPGGWTHDAEPSPREVQLVGPEGEGEVVVAAMAHPSEMGRILNDLKERHPGSAPSPPQYLEVHGIDTKIGERATRFELTGHEAGELVMIERGGVIVLFAAIVAPAAWADLKGVLKRCYPTVEVVDRRAGAKTP